MGGELDRDAGVRELAEQRGHRAARLGVELPGSSASSSRGRSRAIGPATSPVRTS